jgi:transporter family-2 protein
MRTGAILNERGTVGNMWQAIQFSGLAVLAAFAGISFVLQASVNARLRSDLDSPNYAALISYAGGTLVMAAVILASREPLVTGSAVLRAPWWSWTGGLCGAIYVVIIILLLPRLGTAPTIAIFVLGQMLASLVIDHFGWFGVPRHSIDFARGVGALLLVLGVILVRR